MHPMSKQDPSTRWSSLYCAGRRRTTLRSFRAPPLETASQRASRSEISPPPDNHLDCSVVLQCLFGIGLETCLQHGDINANTFSRIWSHVQCRRVQETRPILHITSQDYLPPPEPVSRKLLHVRSRSRDLLVSS